MYHQITLFLVMGEWKQERHAETEAVQDHIEDDGQAKKGDPDVNNAHELHPLVNRYAMHPINDS
jgi:hypothetical protein